MENCLLTRRENSPPPVSVRFLGVRGSLPVASEEFLEYGGNTSCVAVNCGAERVIFDAGTGLTGYDGGESRRFHLFLSHLHLDHLMGLFGFPEFFNPNAEIHMYGPDWPGEDLRLHLETLVGPPYWPVTFRDFSARIQIHPIEPGKSVFLADGLAVHTVPGNHPNKSLLYRLEAGGRSIVYALDCEMNDEMFRVLAGFARGAGLIIWDASFIPGELLRGWGHSTWEEGIALRKAAGAGRIAMCHYAREYSDACLRQQESLAREVDGACYFAKERMEIPL